MRLGSTFQQKAADAKRQQDKLAAEALREQDRLAAEAARDQERLDRQQEMQQHRDLLERLITGLPQGAVNPAPSQNTKLPKRQIKKLEGDILEWTPFWEGYNVPVHQSTIPKVQIFGHLKNYLIVEAQLCVENLELTDANYAIAIATLKRIYGNPHVLIDAHMTKSDSLTQIKGASDTSALHCFQLSIQCHINALENLGIAKRLAMEV